MIKEIFQEKKKKSVEEKLAVIREDRRILTYVPDPEEIRVNTDRRGMKNADQTEDVEDDPEYLEKLRMLSLRYVADFTVYIITELEGKKRTVKAKAVDISSTGLLVELGPRPKIYTVGEKVALHCTIPAGTMPEGFESKVKIEAKVIRIFEQQREDKVKKMVAFEFERPLTEYLQTKRWDYSIYTASLLLFIAACLIVLMRAESVVYFKYQFWLYLYSIIAASFLLSRYLFGALYRHVPINKEYTPGVSIIIPCFNEEQWIHRTILSCVNQEYPLDQLEVIVVDDRSTDRSVERIKEVIERIHSVAERYATKERVKLHVLDENGGKRVALMKGVEMAKHDLVVFVDSDSFLEPTAIKHIVQPFQDPKMGGVAGRTDVENKYTNFLTKLQTVRYYVSFRIMKAAESWFDSVTCLSGPLSCYRKDLVIQYGPAWLQQTFLGRKATFGDDRSMTNFILKTHRTGYQDTAICSTIVPSDLKIFMKQQMRWKRSWLRESLRAGSFIWRKEPFMMLFFYIGLIVPIAAPAVVTYNLIYVPLVERVFPSTFLLGLLLMALLMSCAHLLFRRSRLWKYGLIFCFFYVFVLLWQMPIAILTFWKTSWGTRDTPEDIKEKETRAARKRKAKKGIGLPF